MIRRSLIETAILKISLVTRIECHLFYFSSSVITRHRVFEASRFRSVGFFNDLVADLFLQLFSDTLAKKKTTENLQTLKFVCRRCHRIEFKGESIQDKRKYL